MASTLRQINNDVIDRAKKAEEQRLGKNREWVVLTYQQNPITLDVLKKIANNGEKQMEIYNADMDRKPYNRIGTMTDYNKSPNITRQVCDEEREKMVQDGCKTVKRLFEKANKDNGWDLRLKGNCNSENPWLRVEW